jgi:hypothetical protein
MVKKGAKKVASMTTTEIKAEMAKIAKKVEKENKWLYKNQRHKALLNERYRRAMEK